MTLHRLRLLAICFAVLCACREPKEDPEQKPPESVPFEMLEVQSTGPLAFPSRPVPLCEVLPAGLPERPLLDVWGASPQDVWAAGEAGTLLHWDGSKWSPARSGVQSAIRTLWGSGSNDVWAGGDFLFLLRWNGSEWTHWQLPDIARGVSDIHGSGPNDVWAVSDGRTLHHFNGTSWSSQPAFDRGDTVWASPENLWLAGFPGYAYHRTGSSWAWFEQGPLNVRSIWGSGPDDVWLVGANIHRWHQASLVQVPRPGAAGFLHEVHGAGPNDVWAVGSKGQSLHWEGTSWSEVPTGVSWDLEGVWVPTSGNAFAVGQRGLEVLRWDGSSWRPVPTPLGYFFQDLGMTAQGRGWLVGETGRLRHFDGTTPMNIESPTSNALRAVWVQNETEIWAVGDAGTILRWDGSAWRVEQSNTTQVLRGVWSDGAGEVWAAGERGTLLRRAGGAWSSVPSGTQSDVHALWGVSASDLWAATASEILHWDGRTWNTVVHGAPPLWWIGGSGANDVWIAGRSSNSLLHWDGSSWRRMSLPLDGPAGRLSGLTELAVRGPGDLWLGASFYGGGEATPLAQSLLHWNGQEWNSVALGREGARALTVRGAEVWLLKSNGSVVRTCP